MLNYFMQNRRVSAGKVERRSFRPYSWMVRLPEGNRVEVQLNKDIFLRKSFPCSFGSIPHQCTRSRHSVVRRAWEKAGKSFILGIPTKRAPPAPIYIHIEICCYMLIYLYAYVYTCSLTRLHSLPFTEVHQGLLWK